MHGNEADYSEGTTANIASFVTLWAKNLPLFSLVVLRTSLAIPTSSLSPHRSEVTESSVPIPMLILAINHDVKELVPTENVFREPKS